MYGNQGKTACLPFFRVKRRKTQRNVRFDKGGTRDALCEDRRLENRNASGKTGL